MIVARLCPAPYHTDLSGKGAEIHGGRWNSGGKAVLYTSSCAALAAMESMAYFKQRSAPADLFFVWIEIPDTLDRTPIHSLPGDNKASYRQLGDKWLARVDTPLLIVPSVHVPKQVNVLVNPAHALAGAIKIVDMQPFVFDPRVLI